MGKKVAERKRERLHVRTARASVRDDRQRQGVIGQWQRTLQGQAQGLLADQRMWKQRLGHHEGQRGLERTGCTNRVQTVKRSLRTLKSSLAGAMRRIQS